MMPSQRHARPVRKLLSVWALPLSLVAALGLGLSPAAAADLDLPSIGEPADRTLSPSEEREIGARIVAQLYQQGVIMDDPQLTSYISAVGLRLGAYNATRPVTGLNFFVVRDATINAFALPGGYIGLNTGLIMASRNESEMAGVLGHEIAHVTQRHIARQLQGGEGWNLATAALVIAAIIAGAADPDIVQAALGIGLGSLQQRQISHIRAHELEADRLGIRTLSSAGYDPEGMATFFERMQQTARLYGSQLPEILRTHPVNATRISEARSRLQELGKREREDTLEYSLMKARARILSTEPVSAASEFFDRSAAADSDDPAALYGQALISTLSGNGSQALAQLAPLQERHPAQPNILLLSAQAEHLAGNNAAAVDKFERLLRINPDYIPGTLAFADVLLRIGQPNQARKVLVVSPALQTGEPQAYRLLALAARDANREGEAHYQLAAFHHARGDLQSAVHQLRSGLRRKDITDDEELRLRSRLDDYLANAPKWFREERLRPSNLGWSTGLQ